MGKETKPPARYEDLLALPEHVVGQIIDGELIVMPRPANRHAMAHSVLLGELVGAFQRGRGGPRGWWFITGPQLHFGRDVLVPDIGGWRREHMPKVPDTADFTQAPDWVCEVLSPSTEALDRKRKRELYAREGVGHVWLVDAGKRTLEVFQRQEEQWVQRGIWSDEERVRAEPFEAMELELGALWEPMEQTP
jgi:Uma2 family endonuclease